MSARTRKIGCLHDADSRLGAWPLPGLQTLKLNGSGEIIPTWPTTPFHLFRPFAMSVDKFEDMMLRQSPNDLPRPEAIKFRKVPGSTAKRPTERPRVDKHRRIARRLRISPPMQMLPIACSKTITNPLPSRDAQDPTAPRARSPGPGGGPGASSRPSAHPTSVQARPSTQPQQRAHPFFPRPARPSQALDHFLHSCPNDTARESSQIFPTQITVSKTGAGCRTRCATFGAYELLSSGAEIMSFPTKSSVTIL